MKHTLVKPFRFYCCKHNKLVDSATIAESELGKVLEQYPKLAANIKVEAAKKQKPEPLIEAETKEQE